MALESGAWVVPASGDIGVYRPRIGDDLSALPKARVVVLTGFKGDHDHFAGLGYRVAQVGQFATALICVPRAKAHAHALLAEACLALRPGAVMAVDGQKTDGVEAVLKDCKGLGLELSEAGPLRLAEGFLASQMVDAYEKLYRDVLEERRRL